MIGERWREAMEFALRYGPHYGVKTWVYGYQRSDGTWDYTSCSVETREKYGRDGLKGTGLL